jgi:hypothetical protein
VIKRGSVSWFASNDGGINEFSSRNGGTCEGITGTTEIGTGMPPGRAASAGIADIGGLLSDVSVSISFLHSSPKGSRNAFRI